VADALLLAPRLDELVERDTATGCRRTPPFQVGGK
jgi:hypothetical protein